MPGLLAPPGPQTVAYGGNTSCVQLGSATARPRLDAGTGIRRSVSQLARRPRRPIHILLTHLHLDHLEGLAFFGPSGSPTCEITIWGPGLAGADASRPDPRYLSPPLFPVHLGESFATLTLHDAHAEDARSAARGSARAVTHRGPTVGQRIEEHGPTLTYIPDHEPYLGAGPAG